MLKCENLAKKYMTVTAMKDISVEVVPGKIYALLGPNGSGKSTFMKTVAGLIKPNGGTIEFEGSPLSVESRKHIAYMPTESFFYDYMDCRDVGKFYKDFYEDFSLERFEELMKEMGLSHNDKVRKMSSGMMAKMKLAVTLARDAKLLMLDEPLNGIDLIAREKIINTIITSAKEDNAIIISSHLVDELEKIVDYAIFIKDGVVIKQGDAENLRQETGKSIVDLYKEIYA